MEFQKPLQNLTFLHHITKMYALFRVIINIYKLTSKGVLEILVLGERGSNKSVVTVLTVFGVKIGVEGKLPS